RAGPRLACLASRLDDGQQLRSRRGTARLWRFPHSPRRTIGRALTPTLRRPFTDRFDLRVALDYADSGGLAHDPPRGRLALQLSFRHPSVPTHERCGHLRRPESRAGRWKDLSLDGPSASRLRRRTTSRGPPP